MLPFTRDQFIAVFVDYNLAIWPAQLVAYAIGLTMVGAVFARSAIAGRLVGAGLGIMWLWVGIAYHWLYFAALNKPAVVFGTMFVLQGALVFHVGAVRGRLRFAPPQNASGWLGCALVGYAMILYPLVGIWSAHALAEIPWYGVTPCPTTLFTLGMLLLARSPLPRWIAVVPFLWALVGGSAAILLAIPQDWVLLAASFVALHLMLRRPQDGVAVGA